ncbi:MAG: metal ABC transporter substrate-binding protein [Saprospiraceae bacterium]|nr:MAG: metal ABC transporter substrate-binding protein [Saprospiraceae bacterium]
MKKTWVLWMLILFTTGIVRAEKKPLVVTTASIFADMATVLSGGLVEVTSIVPIGGDPHIYEPTPGDAQLVTKADLILKNGFTFEGWLSELIENSGTLAKVVTITEGIQPIESSLYKNSSDPHAWMSAANGLIYIKNIKDALIALDSVHIREYEFNYDIYVKQIKEVDDYIKAEIQKIPPQRRILITSHDAFRYYGQRYGINVEAILGTSTDADAQTSDLVRLNKIIKESGIPAVFIETTVNPKLLEQLASSNHIGIGGKLYSDSIGDKDSPAPSYLEMLLFNTNTIVGALSQNITPDQEEKNANLGSTNWWLLGVLGILLLGGFFIMFKRLNT